MSFWLLVGLGFVVGVLFLVVVGQLWPGSGSDLLDWDPAGHAEREAALDEEDARQMLGVHNAHRCREGLDPVTREDIERSAGGGEW